MGSAPAGVGPAGAGDSPRRGLHVVDDETGERWAAVPGYEGRYEVSDRGRVRCLGFWVERGYGSRAWWGPRLAKGTRRTISPYYVQYVLSDGERRTAHLAQNLVLAAFVEPRPSPELCGLHRDDDVTNNAPENLYWGTQRDNSDDRTRNGKQSHHNTQACPLGHPLVAPNLEPTKARDGHRSCYACQLTGCLRRRDEMGLRKRSAYRMPNGFWRDLSETFEQEADRRYLFITGQSAPQPSQ